MNSAESALIGALLLAAAAEPVAAATLTVTCGPREPKGFQHCQKVLQAWARDKGHRVKVVSTPWSTTETFTLYRQFLEAGSSDIDIFLIDVIWPGILGSHFIDLKPYAGDTTEQYFPVTIQNDTVGGHLVALPWFADAGALYYRKDLLEKYGEPVPQTWEALRHSAEKIQTAERAAGNDKMWGFVWQGRAYEGLSCDALEWIASFGGGALVDPDGAITVNNPNAVKALETAAGWVGTISPPEVLTYTEEESRAVFQLGDAVFMRNWPYAWALSQAEDSPIKGKVGITLLPKGGSEGRHAAALGGWQLAVSRYSKHPKLAAELVLYLTGYEVQKQRAIELSQLPTIKALYRDPDVIEAQPFFAAFSEVFANAVARPTAVAGTQYAKISEAFWQAVREVLSGRAGAAEELAKLESTLNRISRGGHW